MQIVRKYVHVCDAIMLFGVLKEQESMAQRILMYPSAWDELKALKSESREERRAVETSKRLLQRAAKEYKVMLHPIDPIRADREGWKPEEQYPLTNLLSLVWFNRLIYLPPSGLLLNADPMDLLFTLPMEDRPMLGLADPLGETNEVDILLIEPTKNLLQETTSSLPEGAFLDREFLGRINTSPAPMPSNGENTIDLLAETGSLANVDAQFNATEFLEGTAYVRVKDNGLPGPEYGLPRGNMVEAMPKGNEARKAWEGAYERYREARMDICGLDLEPIEKVEKLVEELR